MKIGIQIITLALASGLWASTAAAQDFEYERSPSSYLRIGQSAIAVDSGKQVTIVGLQTSRNYVVRDQCNNTGKNDRAHGGYLSQ